MTFLTKDNGTRTARIVVQFEFPADARLIALSTLGESLGVFRRKLAQYLLFPKDIAEWTPWSNVSDGVLERRCYLRFEKRDSVAKQKPGSAIGGAE